MNIVIVGCGRVGAELAFRLYQNNHKVSIIDHVSTAFDNLNPAFRGHLVEGEALQQDVLERAGITKADALAAVTNSDPLNAVVGHIARSVFNITSVVARNYDPRWRSLYECFELQVISSSSWGAQRIEELLYHREISTVFSAGNGEVEIYEFSIPATWEDRPLSELIHDPDCRPIAITRAGKAVLPHEDMLLESGDIILASATLSGIQKLRGRLALSEES
ncbi:MAG: TrkA family potassium uptake protein [Anaerolineales bacterium]|nr:MAG: TrkA family potassium uptake protein [Anaerolineales bacterium]